MVQANPTGAPEIAPSEAPDACNPSNPFKLLQIHVYVCLMTLFLAFLVLFGSFRRRCHNGLFKMMVWASYVLSAYLITYILGLMQSNPYLNEVSAIWALLLLIVLGSADSISSYSLEDNERGKRDIWVLFLKLSWLGLIGFYLATVKIRWALWLLYFVTILKTGERLRALKFSSRAGLARKTSLIADFMGYEHELSAQHEVDPTHMKGYNYLVRGESEKMVTAVNPPLYRKQMVIKDKVITIDKIWHCQGRLLTSIGDPDDQLKDICLSFALYKLICRQFAGYPSVECPHKTWNFVRYGLLFKEDDYERAFRVIEVELTFLFDLFYTKYYAIFAPGHLKLKIIELILVIVGCSWVSASVLRDNYIPEGREFVFFGIGHRWYYFDVIVTRIVIIAILFLEVVQIIFLVFSDWAKVILLCKYVQKPSWQASRSIERVVKFVCQYQLLKPWERKLGQYSLLGSFNYNPSRLLFNSITSAYLDSPGKGQRESSRTKLSVEVKKAIILSLKINEKELKNGKASLSRNGVENELSWACELETNTHVIMVWHMATSLCEIALSRSVSSSLKEHFSVATSLSKYCAYLVGFAPRFLPDNPHVSEVIFGRMVIETRDFLNECKSEEEKLEKMMTIGDGDHEKTVIKRGAALGKSLIHGIEDEELRWKILADFWAEMMVFVAPSDHPTIHAESLAEGGQFVTHLWALLSHAGILKQNYKPNNTSSASLRSSRWSCTVNRHLICLMAYVT